MISRKVEMRLSLGGAFESYATTYGYGVAAHHIIKGFEKNDIKASVKDHSSDVNFFFGHPPYEWYSSNAFKIGYTAWESTGYHEDWLASMSEADQLWAPALWLAEHFHETTGKPTYVYPHGVSKLWKPFKHKRHDDKFIFFHIGEPQYRKNGQMVVDAFGDLFGNDDRYMLVMKVSSMNTTRIFTHSGSILGSPDSYYNNIRIIDGMLSLDKIIELHKKVDCLVYPSCGEGFGFHPLEAMASGLPTISTSNWADYKKFITRPIEGNLSGSLWPDLHPGDMFNVTVDQVKDAMIDMVDNYEKYADVAFKNSFFVHQEYDWNMINYNAAEKIKNDYFYRTMNPVVID
jgi:glycosyltransferase involved in cell wall biosynthesis